MDELPKGFWIWLLVLTIGWLIITITPFALLANELTNPTPNHNYYKVPLKGNLLIQETIDGKELQGE